MGIVRAHRAEIEVDSAPGQGSTFRIRFPAAETKAGKRASTQSAAPKPNLVLLIDDEEMILQVAKTALTRAGLAALTATSGSEGMDLFRRHTDEIAAVVLDVTMPDMGGRDVLRALRQVKPDVVVIVSSGHALSEMERHFAEDRPDGFLPKPYTPLTLAAVVAERIKLAG